MRMRCSNFLLVCLLIGLSLLIGCATTTQTDPWASFDSKEQAEWQAIKVKPEFAQKMKSGGVTPNEAVRWINAGFKKPDEIVAWWKAGFAPEEAVNWAAKKISVETAKPWKDNNFAFGEAMDWRSSTNISPAILRDWVDRGFTTPNMVTSWNKEGFKPFVAQQWAKENFTQLDAKNWRDKDFTAKEAGAWNRQGISLTDAINSRAKGLIPKSLD